MKRLVLVLVSAMLLAIFIAFNYLLWEREGREEKLRELESNNAANTSSMNALSREIKSLEEANSKLEGDVGKLKDLNLSLQSDVQRLEKEKANVNTELFQRNDLVDALKKLLSPEAFEGIVKKWVESIEAKKFEEAYKLEYGWQDVSGRQLSYEEYSTIYRDGIKSIKLKEIQIDAENLTASPGEIALVVKLEVKLADGAGASKVPFVNGDNAKQFKLKYIDQKDGFVIESIADLK